ncbi:MULTISPECIES: cytosine permease [Romboutsia]|jgi:cytosine permease|uniref:cytosine permease n=1 Tax=Romboutsia TaxID=1501226 RepID=UPI00216DC295|nr:MULTISPECIES: cytosine permease [Romboutsia]MCI9062028.1 cytosine permease [Romboutsia sp.]MCI9259878.1 cytosine permease [Romboutsia sp.]
MSKKHQDHDYSLEAIPNGDKKGFISMLVVMLGFTFFSASMLAGGNLGTSLSMDKFITAVIIGNIILCIYTGLLAYMAGDTGLSTHLLARYSFGEKGSYLVSFLVSATQVGWFGVGVAMFAIPVSKVTGINVGILVLVSGLLMTATAFFGMKSLTILSMIAVPSIAILGSISAGKAIGDVGGIAGLLSIEPTGTMTMSAALASVVGTFISGGTLTADFTRFSKDKKTAVSTTVIAFLIGNSLMLAFGAIGAMATGQSDIAEVMFMQGLIIPAIIILGLNIWTTNDNALYGSGLGFSNITKQPKSRMVIINGIVGTLLALFLYNNFMEWLNLLNSFIPATGAVIIADYFILNKRSYTEFKYAKFKTVNINAIIAWIAGVIGSYTLKGITPLNSVIVAIVVYVVLSKLNTKSKLNDINNSTEKIA